MYHSELYVFNGSHPVKATVRNYTEEDFAELIGIQAECFPPPFPSELWWNEEQLKNHVSLFPDGAICTEVDGVVAGSMTGLVVNFNPEDPDHTWEEITDNGYIRNHNPGGDSLYVVDISVRPKYRKLGLGKLMMQAMYHIVIQQKLARLIGGGRIPGYHKHEARMTAHEYLDAVLKGDLKDPVVTFLLRCGRTPVAIIENYLEDEESLNYGVLMEWKNPFHASLSGK